MLYQYWIDYTETWKGTSTPTRCVGWLNDQVEYDRNMLHLANNDLQRAAWLREFHHAAGQPEFENCRIQVSEVVVE